MKKVTLIHDGWIASLNGANTVMRLLLNSKELFLKFNIQLDRCTLDDFSPREFSINRQKQISLKYKLRKICKNILNWLSYRSNFFLEIYFRLVVFRSSKFIVSKYLSMRKLNNVSFFHSIIPCYFYLIARKDKEPTVLVMHTNGSPFQMERIYYPNLENSRFYKKLLAIHNYTVSHVDRICFVAEEPMRNFLNNSPHINANKVFYIYNGIPTVPAVPRNSLNKPFEICCVGSISDRKGQQFIIEALKMLDENTKRKVHFSFLGSGFLLSKLKEEILKNDLSSYVDLLGTRSDVDYFLAKSDAFILPSKDEGLPMSILEAMRASLPIISTPVGGIPEMLIDGYNGILIQPNADSIASVLKNIEIYDWLLMGRNARKLYEEKFSSEAMIVSYANLLTFE